MSMKQIIVMSVLSVLVFTGCATKGYDFDSKSKPEPAPNGEKSSLPDSVRDPKPYNPNE